MLVSPIQMVLNREEHLKCKLPVKDTDSKKNRDQNQLTADQKQSIC